MVGRLGPGVDVKSEGYILVEPSVHPSGNLYTWTRAPETCKPVSLPKEWLAVMRKPEPAPRPAGEPKRFVGEAGGTRYGLSALEAECQGVAGEAKGGRNHRLNAAAFSAGQLVAGGELEESYAAEALLEAAQDCGLGEWEAQKTVASGLRSGKNSPRSAAPR
jgi:hypothetical protein